MCTADEGSCYAHVKAKLIIHVKFLYTVYVRPSSDRCGLGLLIRAVFDGGSGGLTLARGS